MTTDQPIIRQRSVPDAIRRLSRQLTKRAAETGDIELGGLALALSMAAERAKAELDEARNKVRICEKQVKRIDRDNKRLRQENDDLTVGLGIADGPRRQINDLIDAAPALSAALTEHEVIA